MSIEQSIPVQRAVPIRSALAQHWLVLLIIGGTALLYLWGMRRDLPYVPESDEQIFVVRAVRMVDTGNPNPGWFGNPGSTMMYPLAAFYWLYHALTTAGQNAPTLQAHFMADPSPFYMIGRLWSVLQAIASVPVVYLIGRRMFGREVALAGAWLGMLSQSAVLHAQLVRTDTGGLFFGMLALWLCLRVYDQPTLRHQLAAGAAIGLAVSARYFMVALLGVLAVTDLLVLLRAPQRMVRSPHFWLISFAGVLAAVAAFALSTPFFVLDFQTALANLRFEARTSQPGWDGLSPLGNLWWYLSVSLPYQLTWPVVIVAAVGVLLSLWRRTAARLIPLAYLLIFMFGTCISPLHWHRWLIQIMPIVGLFAAHALLWAVQQLAVRLSLTRLTAQRMFAGVVLVYTLWPAGQIAYANTQQSIPTTRVLARSWLLEHLPPNSRVVQEWWAAPLTNEDFVDYGHDRVTQSTARPDVTVFDRVALGNYARLDDFRTAGYRYYVTSSWANEAFLSAPERYPDQFRFYQNLFAQADLIQSFQPTFPRGGPVINVYRLRER